MSTVMLLTIKTGKNVFRTWQHPPKKSNKCKKKYIKITMKTNQYYAKTVVLYLFVPYGGLVRFRHSRW